ncbi:MAG TPA: glycosyltransferase family 4 protein [Thermomicrobiaceae bacterium]|nr:glycosyltransferase family 4 protein [Thermomicrobiaceae bacterium]
MRVLIVAPYLPWPPNFGGAARIYHLIRGLQAEHEVITLCLCGPQDDPRQAEANLGRIVAIPVPVTARMEPGRAKRLGQLRSLASPHSFQHRLSIQRQAQEALYRIIERDRPTVAQLEFSQLGAYRVPPGTASVLDVHNIEHDVLRQVARRGSVSPLRRIFNELEFRKLRREEWAAWRRATICVATSPPDASTIERVTQRAVPVIPNGVDLELFPRVTLERADPNRLIFVGAMRYQPNADAARFAALEILPRLRERLPQATLTLAGAGPPEAVRQLAALPGVTVTGTLPDVRPAVVAAGIVVVPLMTGGGTRLKILEAFAMGRPVVSTPLGAAGIEARDGEHLLLASDPAEFVEAVQRLHDFPELASRLTDAAYRLVQDRYQWKTIAQQLVGVYLQATISPSPLVGEGARG